MRRMGANMTTALAPYGALWRTHRRLWHQHFGPNAMEQYCALVQVETTAFVTRLLENDRNVCNQLKLFAPYLDNISPCSLSSLV